MAGFATASDSVSPAVSEHSDEEAEFDIPDASPEQASATAGETAPQNSDDDIPPETSAPRLTDPGQPIAATPRAGAEDAFIPASPAAYPGFFPLELYLHLTGYVAF